VSGERSEALPQCPHTLFVHNCAATVIDAWTEWSAATRNAGNASVHLALVAAEAIIRAKHGLTYIHVPGLKHPVASLTPPQLPDNF
jgi:hypothetical protein